MTTTPPQSAAVTKARAALDHGNVGSLTIADIRHLVELGEVALTTQPDAAAAANAELRREAQTMADDLQAAWEQLCDAADRKDDEELHRAIGRLGIGARIAKEALAKTDPELAAAHDERVAAEAVKRYDDLLREVEDALSSPFLEAVKPAPILGRIVVFRALEAGRRALLNSATNAEEGT